MAKLHLECWSFVYPSATFHSPHIYPHGSLQRHGIPPRSPIVPSPALLSRSLARSLIRLLPRLGSSSRTSLSTKKIRVEQGTSTSRWCYLSLATPLFAQHGKLMLPVWSYYARSPAVCECAKVTSVRVKPTIYYPCHQLWLQARGLKKHLKRLNAPRHWMLDKLGGAFVSTPVVRAFAACVVRRSNRFSVISLRPHP